MMAFMNFMKAIMTYPFMGLNQKISMILPDHLNWEHANRSTLTHDQFVMRC